MCKNQTICNKCFQKFNPVLQRFSVQNLDGLYIYNYDEIIKEKLYQLKGCFDIELSGIFLEYFSLFLRVKFLGYTLIPAPSSKEADEERGFNHVVEIFKTLNLPMNRCVHKTENIKQSDLSANERKNIKNYLKIDDVNLKNKKVLIVDDVFTTGSTINAMIDLLKEKNPKKIKILVMSKTISKEETTC